MAERTLILSRLSHDMPVSTTHSCRVGNLLLVSTNGVSRRYRCSRIAGLGGRHPRVLRAMLAWQRKHTWVFVRVEPKGKPWSSRADGIVVDDPIQWSSPGDAAVFPEVQGV